MSAGGPLHGRDHLDLHGLVIAGLPVDRRPGDFLGVDAGDEHPHVARLAEARPLVAARPLVSDRTVQMKLSAALSSIEALDYLTRAKAEGGDPLALAIDTTFEAILKANAADCTCRD